VGGHRRSQGSTYLLMVAWTKQTAATKWCNEHHPSAVRNGVINTEACSRACRSASPQHEGTWPLLYRQARQAWLRASGGRPEDRLPLLPPDSHYTLRDTQAIICVAASARTTATASDTAVAHVVAMCEPPASHALCGCDTVLTDDTPSLIAPRSFGA